MAVKIRLRPLGKRGIYRIVVTNSTSPRDGDFLDIVGHENRHIPRDKPDRVKLEEEKIMHWLSKGAQPTETVLYTLERCNVKLTSALQQKLEKMKKNRKPKPPKNQQQGQQQAQ